MPRWVLRPGKNRPPVGLVCVTQDDYTIAVRRPLRKTEADRAQAILLAQQELAPEGILVVDQHGRILSFNSKFLSMWRVSRADIEGKSTEEALATVIDQVADPRAFVARIRYIFRHRRESSRDELVLKDGRFFERHSAPIFGGDVYYGRVWYFRDVTERKHQQVELAASVQKYQGIFSKTEQPIVIIDAKTRRVVDANRAALRLYGYSLREFMTRGLADMSAEPDMSRISFSRVVAGESIKVPLRYHKKKNGTKFPAEITSSAFDAGGRTMVIGMVTDLSDRLRAEEAVILRQKAAISQRFIANVSHELRTPTTIVLGYSETLLRSRGLTGKTLRYVRTIYQGALQLRQLIDHLLDLAQLESGKVLARPRKIDLRRFIEDLVKSRSADVHQKGLRLQTRLSSIPPVWMDENHLRRMLFNLLENAIKYTPAGGRIEISLSSSVERAVIAVKDTGIGISKRDLPFIFNRFHRAKTAVRHGIKGTGLGLALVKEIVTAQGGSLWVKSAEGKGSAFYIALPVLKGS